MDSNRVFQDMPGFDQFASYVGMEELERQSRRQRLQNSFMPFRATLYYADLINSSSPADRQALLNIVTPPPGTAPFIGRFDPYGNTSYAMGESHFLQHKYPRTLLFHITDYCIANCQFCYKVNEIRLDHFSDAGVQTKIDGATAYLTDHPEIDNVLLTGGDPAAIRPNVLIRIISALIALPGIRVVRFATKVISYDPFTLSHPDLVDFFRDVNATDGKQVAIIAQINHPAELGPEAQESVKALRSAGVTIRGQPAIIAGVNDSVDTLVRLHRAYLDAGIVPYYFTAFMPVRGVEQYAISVTRMNELYYGALAQLNGLEKRGTLLLSHNFGKVELVGIVEDDGSRKALLKWHEVTSREKLPRSLTERLACGMGDVFMLRLPPYEVYNLDQLFAANGLPYFDSQQRLTEMMEPAT